MYRTRVTYVQQSTGRNSPAKVTRLDCNLRNGGGVSSSIYSSRDGSDFLINHSHPSHLNMPSGSTHRTQHWLPVPKTRHFNDPASAIRSIELEVDRGIIGEHNTAVPVAEHLVHSIAEHFILRPIYLVTEGAGPADPGSFVDYVLSVFSDLFEDKFRRIEVLLYTCAYIKEADHYEYPTLKRRYRKLFIGALLYAATVY